MCPASNYAFSLKPRHFSSRGGIEDKKQTTLPAINKDCFLEKGRLNKAFKLFIPIQGRSDSVHGLLGRASTQVALPWAPVASCADRGDVKVSHAGREQWLSLMPFKQPHVWRGLARTLYSHASSRMNSEWCSTALPGGRSCPGNIHMRA